MVSFGKNNGPQADAKIGLVEIVVQKGTHDTQKWFCVSIYKPKRRDRRLGAVFVRSCCDEHASDSAVEFARDQQFIPPELAVDTVVADMNGDRPRLEFRGKFIDGLEFDRDWTMGAERIREVYLMTDKQIASEPEELNWYSCKVLTMEERTIGYYFVQSNSQADATTRAGVMYREQVLLPKKDYQAFCIQTHLASDYLRPCAKYADRLIPLEEMAELARQSKKDFIAILSGEKTP